MITLSFFSKLFGKKKFLKYFRFLPFDLFQVLIFKINNPNPKMPTHYQVIILSSEGICDDFLAVINFFDFY